MAAWARPSTWAQMRQRSTSKFFMRFLKPSPFLPTRMSSVSTTSSKYMSQNGMICWPILWSGAVVRPGVSSGTSHIDISRLSRDGSSSLAMRSTSGKFSPLVTQVFWPLSR